MTDPDDEGPIALLLSAFRRWNGQPGVMITLSKTESWTLMGLLQLLHRHPDMESRTLRFVERVGRQIQGMVCDDPELYVLAEAGWDPALDQQEPGRDQLGGGNCHCCLDPGR